MDIDFNDRNDWGFKDMEIDQVMEIVSGDLKAAQKYAHTYGNQTGKKFATRTKGGFLYVKRLA